MSGDALMQQGRFVEAGQLFEREHRIGEAVAAYRRAEAWAEAGRLLFQEHQYLDAARTLLLAVPTAVSRGARPDEDTRRVLRSAAVAFTQGDKPAEAAALYILLDERDRAADVLRRAGRRPEAIAVLQGKGVSVDPLKQSRARQTGRPSNPLLAARTPAEALKALATVDPREPRYAEAARRAVMIAWQHDILEFDLDHWLGPWLRGGELHPHGASDMQPLYSLGLLYVRKGLPESAEIAFRAVLRLSPGLREAREQLATLADARERKDVSALQRILDEDKAFRQAADPRVSGSDFAHLPSLPDLPDLPSLPSIPAVAPVPAPATTPGLRANGLRASKVTETATVDAPVLARSARPATTPGEAAPMDPRTLAQGDRIADRYVIERELGRGGMGVVFKVADTMLEEEVALKIISRPGGSTLEVARFKEEMKICRRLSHPNIVRVFEFGAWRGNHFLTLELLEGEDMEDLIKKARGPVPLLTALPLLLQACDGLGAAHKQGVVHRDVKPPNFFVTDEGRGLKVMDFGIAKVTKVDASLTATGTLVGSPAYIAPERLYGEDADSPASDLYALGVVMYQLFTGVLPFRAKEMPALFMQHVSEIPVPPSRRNPELTQALDDIVLRLLEKDPADRYSSMRALRKAVEAAWGELLKTGV